MMPRALLPRDQKNLLLKRYSILTIALLDSHHGVTRYPAQHRTATRFIEGLDAVLTGHRAPTERPSEGRRNRLGQDLTPVPGRTIR